MESQSVRENDMSSMSQELHDDIVVALSCPDTHYVTPRKLVPSPRTTRRQVISVMLDKGLLSLTHIKGKYAFTELAYDLRHRHNLVAPPSVATA